ncbi:hypothetical protein M2475_002285 [Breznakia sp. PF5-3]|uniref:hypothetical protein n=1 Tax=unclassified Breznakia TaxID=2623764 RepID=UPI0024053681|nr:MULTISPECIES: hypothetical protein [unclassified Breznakia]MDF9825904.1 hypothetical protein [Breznakia sp. PM6-1]MDF9836699.1 hypothetical protein [Breznakia sp. PF5-3]MDF9838988.1 hypothetical protein [Breznakia sp. PFB2-8]MDF9861003.1 hypothetical protein [Breznakia sp. PH5-24]
MENRKNYRKVIMSFVFVGIYISLLACGTGKTDVDLTNDKYIDINYEGVSGAGSITVDSNYKYDEENVDLTKFYNSISYNIEPNEELQNGDTVVLTMKFDEDLAEKANINVTKYEKSWKVKGLDIAYTNYNRLSEKEANKIKSIADNVANNNAKKDIFLDSYSFSSLDRDKDISVSDPEIVAIYFCSYEGSEYESSGDMIFLYKVTVTGTKTSFGDRTNDSYSQKAYMKYKLDNITKNKVKKLKEKDIKIEKVYDRNLTDDEIKRRVENDYTPNGIYTTGKLEEIG